jgi:hypothetical protein
MRRIARPLISATIVTTIKATMVALRNQADLPE